MSFPKRVKVDWRVKGGKRPEGVIECGRNSEWGNPFRVGGEIVAFEGARPIPIPDAQTACKFFRTYATYKLKNNPHWLDPLVGATWLACPGCDPADEHCHVQILLDLMRDHVANWPRATEGES
jgi:hypothetical protein